ncbi:magnesium transporter CorA family protein [Listeria sp. PSOL-1]|uniref:magnesium transporter CorA family protein n=1 Tax=Listeria sp. PSOL-1 TaxID=1844999 RepID=UPI0013CF69AD|nr:magnesium transporter CorA family protein [Listeria sp. PSOL-1]
MITYYKTAEDQMMKQVEQAEVGTGAWIKVIDPTESEIESLSKQYDIPKTYFFDALDSEERSRIEMKHVEESFTHSLVIVETPYQTSDELGYAMFETLPIGIIVTQEIILTISLKENPITNHILYSKDDHFDTKNHIQFLLQMLYTVSSYFLKDLYKLISMMNKLEGEIKQAMKNEQLYAFMAVQKSLVFFATALQSNKAILDKMKDSEHFTENQLDHDLLRDVMIENKQAIAMTDTYTQIISGMSDVFSSVISNNLNIVMKFLASFTIILSLPTIIGSIYGMNVKLPFMHDRFAFTGIMIFTFVITACVTVIFWRRKYF